MVEVQRYTPMHHLLILPQNIATLLNVYGPASNKSKKKEFYHTLMEDETLQQRLVDLNSNSIIMCDFNYRYEKMNNKGTHYS
jgi:hypothetical protein